MTLQEMALKKARRLYGKSAFTEDTVNYKRVGFYRQGTCLKAIGDTWDEAFSNLELIN